MELVKGAVLGRGSFATVNLAAAVVEEQRKIIAVKSALLSQSQSLQKEADILSKLQDCPQILTCFGHEVAAEKGASVYNLLLEYVPGGSLSDYVRASGGRLPERRVARIAKSVLRGLCFVHGRGYVHCDIKPQNLLVTSSIEVKIADFGLAKEAGETVAPELRGTPLYMSPEAVARGECEAPADVWALGCVVSELVTGKPAWGCGPGADVAGLLFRIGFGDEAPEIPLQLSEQGRDFISRCFTRDPAERWTAEMLLCHPFLAGDDKEEMFEASPASNSPRSALDLKQWNSLSSASSWRTESLDFSQSKLDQRSDDTGNTSPFDRIQKLAGANNPPSWFSSSSDDWITARGYDSPISMESEDTTQVEKKFSDDSKSVLEMMVIGDGNREEVSNEFELPEFGASTSSMIDSIRSSLSRNQHECNSYEPDALFSTSELLKEKNSRCNMIKLNSIKSRNSGSRSSCLCIICADSDSCNFSSHEYKFNLCFLYIIVEFSPSFAAHYLSIKTTSVSVLGDKFTKIKIVNGKRCLKSTLGMRIVWSCKSS